MTRHRKARRTFLQASALAAVTSLALSWGAGAAQAEGSSYILATATTGGTYYPVGVALATLVKIKLQASDGIDMSAISSAGSAENIRMMRSNDAQFSILQGLFGVYGRDGIGPLEQEGPQANLRSITALWQNVEHFLLIKDLAETGTIEDMKNVYGQPYSMGAATSGTRFSNEFILGNLGIDHGQFEQVHKGYGSSIDDLRNGVIVGTNPAAGPPAGAVTRALAQMGDDIAFLQFTEEQARAADGGNTLYSPYTIEAGTYPGQEEDWRTIAQPNFLAVNADVAEEHVYLITKTIYENLPFLINIHAATDEMSLETALTGLPFPLHPGAARFYDEVGIDIPEHLRPQ
ncbi:TAXI family TRAP transporter solute-binding subunit [Aquibaculum arenosum]|uniref:TAXI family TRAP transporter solute-binding subunit n=1 Tax=Aquibaculum arenosum TaxID=3032591 RepID=A0ABT5YPJ8_9PROT|nr:TAXI family TRAP transporter solute-binding subunit [Fodinicurvata sp. CAU 1616]MDF2096809.1 TAXI family TRAP transporter solute-binding subunit [Fodinicurvata sp. CAU 1616]